MNHVSFNTRVQLIILWVGADHGTVTADQVRRVAGAHGIVAVHPNHWGQAFRSAQANGLIRPITWGRSSLPSRNSGGRLVWELTEVGAYAVAVLDESIAYTR